LSALQTYRQITKFFELCDEEFSSKELKLLSRQLATGGVQTQDKIPDTEVVRAILQHCDVKMRAIILCLASGGMRIGELLNVRCDDVDLKSIPAIIQIRASANGKKTKTGHQRYTFISSEAVAAVREWIKIRPAYLESASKMGKNFKSKRAIVNIDDDRLFPVSDNSVNEALKDAVTAVFGKNEVDPTTNRSTIHIHGFRKFFISQFSLSQDAGLDIANFLAGHANVINKTYVQLGPKQMSQYYLKGERALYIEAPAELVEEANLNKKELDTVKGNQNTLNSQMISLMLERDELRKKVAAAENWYLTEGVRMMEQMAFMQKQIEDMSTLHGKMVADELLKNQTVAATAEE
jgi:integrase